MEDMIMIKESIKQNKKTTEKDKDNIKFSIAFNKAGDSFQNIIERILFTLSKPMVASGVIILQRIRLSAVDMVLMLLSRLIRQRQDIHSAVGIKQFLQHSMRQMTLSLHSGLLTNIQ